MKKLNILKSDFRKAKESDQLIEEGYKDFLSPEGRKFKKNYAKT